jgi:hypothetical protein
MVCITEKCIQIRHQTEKTMARNYFIKIANKIIFYRAFRYQQGDWNVYRRNGNDVCTMFNTGTRLCNTVVITV